MSVVMNQIAGAWVAGEAEVENRNPSDLADLIGVYAQASRAQLHEAATAARAAQPLWAATGLEARANVLDAVGRELMARSAELGRLLSR